MPLDWLAPEGAGGPPLPIVLWKGRSERCGGLGRRGSGECRGFDVRIESRALDQEPPRDEDGTGDEEDDRRR